MLFQKFSRLLSFLLPSLLIGFLFLNVANARQTDTLYGKNIYKPVRQPCDTVRPDSSFAGELQRKRDSIEIRIQFVKDSLQAREIFIRDSLQRRKQIIDSLVTLKKGLQGLLEAYVRSVRDDIVLRCHEIDISGDSALGDFTFTTLPFGIREPYIPWKTSYELTGRSIRINTDPLTHDIIYLHTTGMKASFIHSRNEKLLVINEPAVVQKNGRGNFYKISVDSVFYDNLKRISVVRSYILFFSVINGNQKGNLLFTNRTQVKQFEYDTGNEIRQYRLVKFCERWQAHETNSVCSILSYGFTKQGNMYKLTRRNDPANGYSDGTYTFKFDDLENLTSVSFVNLAGTENWERLIELNRDGNVSCYIDKTNNIIRQSICMIYHDKEPQAKHKVETITTVFEKDGISYLQKNNTTGRARTRDRMTLEWSPWQ